MIGEYNYGTGRRKTAIARVFLRSGSGKFVVNDKPVDAPLLDYRKTMQSYGFQDFFGVGDLIDGMFKVMAFFAVAALIATAIIFSYTRCVRSTALVVACSVVAVVWQLGLVAVLGFELDPFSILVPFLVFAIGVSHGAQKMNGIMQDIARGAHRLVAARYTFRRLFLAGLTALLIREMANHADKFPLTGANPQPSEWSPPAPGNRPASQTHKQPATAPAKLFGLFPKKGTIAVGSDADVVLFDPTATQTIHAHELHSNCDYTLLEGRSLRGKVEKVFLRGELIVDGPTWRGREGMGRFVPRGEVRAF